MPGKRKRGEDVTSGAVANENPLSAIAAARLRAGAAAKGITTPGIKHEPVHVQSSLPPESPGSGYGKAESEKEEEEEGEGEALANIKRNFKLCNWRNDTQDILSDTDAELIINLNKHATIALIGCFEFRVLRGAININGANIGSVSREGQKNSIHRAFVSATSPIFKVRGLDSTNHVKFMSCKDPTPLAGIGPLFADIWNAAFVTRSFSIITESHADQLSRNLSPEVIPDDWVRAIEDCASTSPPSITLITGTPMSGKSTFARRLLNRHLTGLGKTARPVPAVCYIDLDPSKPEYTTSGQISLVVVREISLSPRFIHPVTVPNIVQSEANQTIRAHPIPVNLANYAVYYSSCVEDLFLSYRNMASRHSSLPLIINTPGFLYASRFDLLHELLARFKPHDIIHLTDTQAIGTETATKMHLLQANSSRYRSTIHEITAQPPLSAPLRTEVEIKAMHMQSYFHLQTSNAKPGEPVTYSWASEPLSHLVPWEFCYRETPERLQDIVGFAIYAEPIEPASLVHALNGSIVHIVQSSSSTIPSPYTALPRTNEHGIPYLPKSEGTGMVEPLDPRTSRVICTAMIRGFDPGKQVVQVLVPRTHEDLLYNLSPERTVFVGGCCDMPGWVYLEDASATESMTQSALSASGEPEGGLVWVEKDSTIDDMGYLNTVRRVRKFQT